MKRTSVFALCAFGATLMVTYALIRPAVDALFLSELGSHALPGAWIAVAVTAGIASASYHHYGARFGLMPLFRRAVIATALLISILLIGTRFWPRSASFALYIVKDIYIVILVELLWAMANSVYDLKSARWAYGLFLFSGTLGGFFGNMTTRVVTRYLGSIWLPAFSLPVFAALFASSFALQKRIPNADAKPFESTFQAQLATDKVEPISVWGTWAYLRESPYLGWLILLVAVVQVVVTLIDFEFNDALARIVPTLDQRTRTISNVYVIVDIVSVALQLGSVLIFKAIGTSAVLIGTPLILLAFTSFYAIGPNTYSLIMLKVASKALDFSLFRAAKEILYLPLSKEDKTKGKSLVDVFSYRSAKAAASLLLLAWATYHIPWSVTYLAAALILAWTVLTWRILIRHRKETSHTEALQKI